MTIQIPLGSKQRVSKLYSFPNAPTCPWTLEETVKHWFDMTLERDGLGEKGARASVAVEKSSIVLALDGPEAIQADLAKYADRLPTFLKNGWNALTKTIPRIKADKKWDPSPDPEPPTYHPWRFFMPHGMAMLRQRAVLFFHYPPIRLLVTNQDYLNDPVPVRCEELLTANGTRPSDLPLFNTVMDATPIGAEDSQGSKKAGDPTWGLIPINEFHDYQRSQVELLLNLSDHAGYTVPIVVYGAHPLATFNEIYGTKLRTNQVTVAEIVKGRKTPVMASTHPYVFYGMAQGFDAIGSGKMVDEKAGTAQMLKDLVVARWLKLMSDDPTQDPGDVLKHCQAYWNSPAQGDVVSALVQHQGSLFYSNPATLTFQFLVPLPTLGQPASALSTPAPVSPATKTAPAATAKSASPKGASSVGKAAPGKTQSAQRGKLAKTFRPDPSMVNVTTVIGDSGKPVDWWFIYKISKESQTTYPTRPTGAEHVYFDSVMAQNPLSQLAKSDNPIHLNSALYNTLSPLFSDAAKSNPDLGWYCYNDEDRYEKYDANGKGKGGTGPSDRGHCKGTVAFDLANDTGFWLIHSVPLFPLQPAFAYPDTGFKMAQTMLCIQLANASTAMDIAQLMYDMHGPNVHLPSDLLVQSKNQPYGFPGDKIPLTKVPETLGKNDPRVLLMQNLNGSMGRNPKPMYGQRGFYSKGGQGFLAIAKNKAWGNVADDAHHGPKDFYNDLVSVALNEDVEVETWENAGNKIPQAVEHGEKHKVENMLAVDLGQIGIHYSWSEKVDHAKLAISDRTNPEGTPRWVCVGDINFTLAQERRGGGTVAFKCEPLWNSLAKVLSDQAEPEKKTATKKTATKKTATKKTATKKTATK